MRSHIEIEQRRLGNQTDQLQQKEEMTKFRYMF
ncbi:hypothetical protein SAM_0998 [Streptococcus agalactiae CJB111]|nr:hypothetical protein SAM_0998 [Streptococcus agalactiae CJB111]